MKQYELIQLEDYTQSGEGGQGVAYTHKREKRLAKLYNPGFDVDMAIEEFEVARMVYESGIPTPRPFRLITDGERVGTEYELIEGKRSFARIISQQPERMQEISIRFANACKALHATAADVSRIPSMKARMLEFIKREGMMPPFYRDRLLPVLEQIPDTPTCLHGDMQIGNIITDGTKDLWIDVGQFSYGSPLWDLSMCWRVCQMSDPTQTDQLFHLTPEQMQQHWGIFACAYHGVTPQELGGVIREYLPYSAIKIPYMYYITFHRPISEEIGHRLSEMMLGGD